MSLLSAFDVRLCRTALIGIALTACAGSSEEHTPGVNYDRYGISWTGIVGSPTSDTLTVKACWNDECPTLTLPITGLAPASAFVQAQPDPPEGAPASVQGGTPGEDGSCWGRMDLNC